MRIAIFIGFVVLARTYSNENFSEITSFGLAVFACFLFAMDLIEFLYKIHKK